MSYLYGDSTPSKLQSNFIELLRRALDTSVQVLQADLRLAEGRERRAARERKAQAELVDLDALVGAVGETLQASAQQAGDKTPAARCAETVSRAATAAAAAERDAAKSTLAAEIAAIEAEAARERAACVKALEALVLRHDLPDAASTVLVTAEGTHFVARLRQKTSFGLEVTIDLDVPGGSPLSHDLRLERLMEGLELHAPEAGGVFRKQLRSVPHKLGKHHVLEVMVAGDGTRLVLRETHERTSPGFDVTIRTESPNLSVTRMTKEGEVPIYEVSDHETARFLELDERVRALVADLVGGTRRSLIDARLDGTALAEHDHPAILVERLIAAIAPIVQEIARHSLTTTELVLKRALADDRREEIFVSKAELVHKLDPLPEPQRALFAALGLGANGSGHLAAGSTVPRIATPIEPDAGPSTKFSRQTTNELTEVDIVEAHDDPASP